MKKLPVNLDDVAEAMDQRDLDMMTWYLDTQTGAVLLVTTGYRIEEMDEEQFNALPPREREEQADSWRVHHDDTGRYEHIPAADGREAYALMERFIATVADPSARRQLSNAIAGKGAFRRFKDTLMTHSRLEEEWFRFEESAKRQWARDWLESLDIESIWQTPVPPPKPPKPAPSPVILGLDHAQITVPKGQEQAARRFYCDVLKMKEIPKPPSLQGRGGLWLSAGELQLHIGVEDGVDRSTSKAHLAYRVNDTDVWQQRLRKHGVEILESVPIPGFRRFEFRDPFGNRVEMIQPENP